MECDKYYIIQGSKAIINIVRSRQASKRQQGDQDEREHLRSDKDYTLNFSDEENLRADVEGAEDNCEDFASSKKGDHGRINMIRHTTKEDLANNIKTKIIDNKSNNQANNETKFNVIKNKTPLNQRIIKKIRNYGY